MSSLEDRELYGKVRWALEKESGITDSDLIRCSVVAGTVDIWGEVRSAGEKVLAEQVVRRQPGVRDVINSLTVAIVTGQRQGLEKAVEQALEKALGSRAKNVGVKKVDRGEVHLAGHAASLAEEQRAITAASSIPGVRSVLSEVIIGDVAAQEAIEVIDDAGLRSLLNSAIAERGVTVYDENSEVRAGIAYLRGMVVEERERSLAEQIARGIAGVQDVVNELMVVHVTSSTSPDEALAAHITRALHRDGRVSPAQVHVECVGGVARLYGQVQSIDDQNAAISIARGVPGVRQVLSDVLITDRSSFGSDDKGRTREHGRG